MENLLIGNASDLKKHINSSTVLINMQGKVILPGLIDAHTHPGYVAGASEMIELFHTGTKEDVFAALIDHVNLHQVMISSLEDTGKRRFLKKEG